ncbi:hypothetical protein ONE63_003035 [Megalurothrips usitatus]|uniref:FGFR1 oncogene partner (FOP) N-terminal dimerisation domain-containing protein n=1 Tax=Megalurothrips usitatus TaxID=439358 RepID=A0AAV7X9R4_9NEOP|nr:hypothetical protein ONE63_003035 [Megalurothrips usitatus]
MSVEEDTELRDLVSKTLENNGVLAKIRAELRASVFLALEEQEANSTPFENKALKEYLRSSQAALGLCIVREFLEYLELDFTLSVYNTETSHGKGYEYCGRNKLIKDLRLKNLNGKKGPLLSHILQIAQESSGISTEKEGSTHNSPANTKASTGDGIYHNISNQDGLTLESPNVSLAPLDRTFTSDGPTVLSLSTENRDVEKPISPQSGLHEGHVGGKLDSKSSEVEILRSTGVNSHDSDILKPLKNDASTPTNNTTNSQILNSTTNNRKPSSDGHTQTKSTTSEPKNPMASLNDLPPLDGLHSKRNMNNANSINFAGLGLQDEYEEDFHSTDSSAAADGGSKHQSHGQKSSNKVSSLKENSSGGRVSKSSLEKEASDKAANSPIGSISEDIDDDTNSGIDDLLNSNASTENTVDGPISHIRNTFADYMEDI